MKDGSAEDISRVVEKAKGDVHKLLVSGRVFEYKQLRLILDTADPMTRFVPYSYILVFFSLVILMLSHSYLNVMLL